MGGLVDNKRNSSDHASREDDRELERSDKSRRKKNDLPKSDSHLAILRNIHATFSRSTWLALPRSCLEIDLPWTFKSPPTLRHNGKKVLVLSP